MHQHRRSVRNGEPWAGKWGEWSCVCELRDGGGGHSDETIQGIPRPHRCRSSGLLNTVPQIIRKAADEQVHSVVREEVHG